MDAKKQRVQTPLLPCYLTTERLVLFLKYDDMCLHGDQAVRFIWSVTKKGAQRLNLQT